MDSHILTRILRMRRKTKHPWKEGTPSKEPGRPNKQWNSCGVWGITVTSPVLNLTALSATRDFCPGGSHSPEKTLGAHRVCMSNHTFRGVPGLVLSGDCRGPCWEILASSSIQTQGQER